MNNITIYSFENEKIRVVEHSDGNMWFVARDVACVLGYSDTQAMTRRIDELDINTYADSTSGQVRHLSIVNESGLYACILNSQKPQALKFKRWITSEVLPSIRKTGNYSLAPQVPTTLKDALLLAYNQQVQIEEQQNRINRLVHDKKTYTATEVAKESGFRSAMAFNVKLVELGFHYKVNGTYVPTAKYMDSGYTSIKQTELGDGRIVYDRRFTAKGRDFILDLLNKKD